jgi:DNA-binding Lrp family transcriptional regulator
MEYDRTKNYILDKTDLEIINIIGLDSRIPTLEIAKKLNISTITINTRIKKLLESGVIQRFRIFLDESKLGFKTFKIHLILKNYDQINDIINCIEKNPHLTDIDYNMGYADIEFVFRLKGADQFFKIVDDLSSKYPESIKNYTYIGLTKSHKLSFLPKINV